MNAIVKYFSGIAHGLKTLATGMKITGYYFSHARKEIITQQYPENRDELQMFDRFRGIVEMPHDENNEHACTGCQACEVACPNGSIEILWERIVNPETGKKKKTIDKHVYHFSMCTLCNLCIIACPTDAIKMGQNFEYSVFDRKQLTYVLNKPGSKVRDDVED
ncbi:MAG: NADH-quinone oxidoreductase subunit I [Bacteroidetes bacterium]|nr:MAG: NADH-quinone oxidoreductase subunit I [Bacteroidota bacterium]